MSTMPVSGPGLLRGVDSHAAVSGLQTMTNAVHFYTVDQGCHTVLFKDKDSHLVFRKPVSIQGVADTLTLNADTCKASL